MSDTTPAGEHGRPHGKTSSWVLVGVMLAAFAAGGGFLITGVWTGFYACLGIFAAGVPVGWLVGIMDDTVSDAIPRRRAEGRAALTALELPPPNNPGVGETRRPRQ